MLDDLLYSPLLIIGLVGFAVSLGMTRVMMWINIQDVPIDRSSHAHPTPGSGGVAIVIGFLAFMTLTVLITPVRFSQNVLVALGGASLMALIGFLDDLYGLGYKTRLLQQVFLAIGVVLFNIHLTDIYIPFIGQLELGGWGPLLSVFWIVGFANAFNFMDGLNGLSSGGALIGCLFLWHLVPAPLELIMVGIIWSILGFFCFNFLRGKIFMGDVGSQFIGFLLPVFALVAAQNPQEQLSFYALPLVFFSFLFDPFITVLRRAFQGQNVFLGHRGHLFQILNRLGWSHTQVSLLQYNFIFLQGLGAVVMHSTKNIHHLSFFVPYVIIQGAYALIIFQAARKAGLNVNEHQ